VVLDRAGVVVATNRAAMTKGARSGQPLPVVLGALAAFSDADGAAAVAGVTAVLSGAQRAFSLEFLPDSVVPGRWSLRRHRPLLSTLYRTRGKEVHHILAFASAPVAPFTGREQYYLLALSAGTLEPERVVTYQPGSVRGRIVDLATPPPPSFTAATCFTLAFLPWSQHQQRRC
jgi:hypothetical protein